MLVVAVLILRLAPTRMHLSVRVHLAALEGGVNALLL